MITAYRQSERIQSAPTLPPAVLSVGELQQGDLFSDKMPPTSRSFVDREMGRRA